ncbi:MAG: bifunctional DNA primase/polymerase [Hyphomonadaceae bacterium]|nr:bifunctional DNA primase/polymerase [Hyphomonadaceae bacterium]
MSDELEQLNPQIPFLPEPSGSIIESAVAYALAGFAVHPCRPIDKTPLTLWRMEATNDPERARQLFRQLSPSMIAIALAGGHFVIDGDPKPAGSIPKKYSYLLCAYPELAQAPMVSTPSGGFHLHCWAPAGVKIGNRVNLFGPDMPGIDVRAEGGYIMAPPSRRSDGGEYLWANPHRRPALASARLIEALISRPKRPAAPPSAPTPFLGTISRYARGALVGELMRVASAQRGERNATLNTAAFKLGTLIGAGLLPMELVARLLERACDDNGLALDDGPASVAATIQSGLRAGMRHPRNLGIEGGGSD